MRTVGYLVYGLAAAISTAVGGWLVDRHRPGRVAAASISGIAVAFTVLAVLASLSGGGRADVPPAVLLLVIGAWSLIGWWFNPAQNKRLLDFAGAQGAVVLSLSASAIYAGQALGGLVGAATVGAGPVALAGSATACTVLALVLLLLTARN